MKKMLALALVLVLMAAMVSGCSMFGKAKELKEAVDEFSGIVDELNENADNEEVKLFDEQLYVFEDFTDLLAAFKEFGYEWYDADGAVEWWVEWEILGQEEIDGVAATHVLFTMFEYDKTVEREVWFNDDWTSVKSFEDGEEKEGWEADLVGNIVTVMAQTYVNYTTLANMLYADYSRPGLLDGSAYKIESESSESINIGGSTKADVYKINSLWLDAYWEVALAKVGGKHLYVTLLQGEEDALVGLRVTRAVAR